MSMVVQRLFEEIRDHIDAVIAQSTLMAQELWREFLTTHPVDIAEFLNSISYDDALALLKNLPGSLRLEVFHDLSHSLKVKLLESLNEHDRNYIITNLSIDDLTDFFDDLSDAELENYLKLLHKKDQRRVLSLLQFNPETAGGIMATSVLTLMQDFTVEKSIKILQKLQPSRELHQHIYVLSQNNELVGHINLEDLVLKHPKTQLRSILRPNVLVVDVDEDREKVAQQMMHYGVSNIPVIGHDGVFLGVIPSEALVEIIEEEAGEDIYRMSAVSPIKHTYFETPFKKLLYQRSSILIVLLMVQTFSSMIIEYYQALLCGFLTFFISMLTSTGGNASSQTSAFAIQGLATGEINDSNSKRFIRREFFMAIIMAILLGFFSFVRIYITHYNNTNALENIAVSGSLAVIVLVSITLGSCMPLLLRRLNIDPAHSAGPLLTTVIDVVGLLIYCLISSSILGR